MQVRVWSTARPLLIVAYRWNYQTFQLHFDQFARILGHSCSLWHQSP